MQRSLRIAASLLLASGALALAVPSAGAGTKPQNCQGADLKRSEPAPDPPDSEEDVYASPADIADGSPGAVERAGGGLVVSATLTIDDPEGLGATSCSRVAYTVTAVRATGATTVGAPVSVTIPGDGSRNAEGIATLNISVELPALAGWEPNSLGNLCYRVSASSSNPGTGQILDAAPNAGSIGLCVGGGAGVRMY